MNRPGRVMASASPGTCELPAERVRLLEGAFENVPTIDGAIRDNQAYADQYGVRLDFTERADASEAEVDSQRLQQGLAISREPMEHMGARSLRVGGRRGCHLLF